ncbi:PREDICTED: protein ACCELERATED CELL DEATH 6 [Nelumbo nucifera]|uniref:PGG domain-containing protein n=2 Tax=Nelumbo nucifera TaxID=4432 RepID=A0A822XMU1_NELNU|nr:PREDICTED: protein ACCELERATED CELL DEATH 6 [Nelumbo nucifera]DAD22924.1 TPA_asm: hypothetical protein HUJ06_024387 [Nelumbo nucifera]
MDPKLYEAVTTGKVHILRQLAEEKPGILLQLSRPKRNTVLHIAASFDSNALVELIYRYCPDAIEKKNFRGDTALHIAARTGNISMVTFLIDWATHFICSFSTDTMNNAEDEGDANVLLRVPNIEGNTPLHEAVRGRHRAVAEVLMKHDPRSAFTVNRSGESPLYLAADRGLLDFVQQMLQFPLQDTSQDIYGGPNGQTPLHAAIARRHTAVVNVLASGRKELINTKDDDGRTPLHYAATFGFADGALCLLREDTSAAYQKDNDGRFPIHMAASKGHTNIIRVLLGHCLESRELLNRNGQNALHVAAKSGKDQLVTYILRTPALEMLINETDNEGNTPLHLATMHSHPKIVNILAHDARVDMIVMNNEGSTALDIAEKDILIPTSFRKLLTLTALRTAGAPRGRRRSIVEGQRQEETQDGKNKMDYYKDRINTLVLVATLVATITFAAGVTMPGGYRNDEPNQGMAVLHEKPTFHVFVISNTLAMYVSMILVVTLIWAQLGDYDLLVFALKLSLPLLGMALTMMAIAFAAGVYLVVHKPIWLGCIVVATGSISLLCILVLFLPLHVQLWSKYRGLRYISSCVFRLLIFAIGHKLYELGE